MKALLVVILASSSALLFAQEHDPFASAALVPAQHQVTSGGPRLSLEELLRTAQQSNPEIRVASRRVVVAEARVPAAGALDDPSAMYRGWQIPLRQPGNLNAAMNMFMVGQSLPGPGKRGLRSQIASDDVSVAKAELEGTKREVAARVRKAVFDLFRNADELRIHDEQVGVTRQGVEAARIKYTVGRVPQQDVLKAQIALTKLAEHLVMLRQDGALAKATLNTLLGRDPAAPLEVIGKYTLPAQLPSLADLRQLALHSRPELQGAAAAIQREEDHKKLAQKNRGTPDFSVNVGYMLLPEGSPFRNNYMAEASMTLPWFNSRKHDAEIAEASAQTEMRRSELESARLLVFQQIQVALIRAQAARELVDLYQNTLRPQAQATLKSTVIAYENDRTDFLNLLDSQNTTLEVELSYFRALAAFEAHMTDLELAVGTEIPRNAAAKTGGAQ